MSELVLKIGAGESLSNATKEYRVNGWPVFIGATVDTASAQVQNRLLILEIPNNHGLDKEAATKQIKLYSIEIRKHINAVLMRWSADPAAMKAALKIKQDEAVASIKASYGQDLQSTLLTHLALLHALCSMIFPEHLSVVADFIKQKAKSPEDVKLRPFIGFIETLDGVYQKHQNKQRGNTIKGQSDVWDSEGICYWNYSEQRLMLNVKKAINFLKNHKALSEPITCQQIYPLLGITDTKNKISIISKQYPWVSWLTSQNKDLISRGFYRQAALSFDLVDINNAIPEVIKSSLWSIVAKLETI